MAHYLQKRGSNWYASMELPKNLRPYFGRARFIRSLKTDSRTVAQRRVGPIVASWKAEIARARPDLNDDAAFFQSIDTLRSGRSQPIIFARDLARRLLNAKTDEQRQMILEQIEDIADDIGALDVPHIGMAPSTSPKARRFVALATGQLSGFLDHLDDWLATSQATARTQAMQRAELTRFAATFKMVQDVQRPEVKRWISGFMSGPDALAPRTISRILAACRAYWRYLQSIEVVGEDHEPFDRLDVARNNKSAAPRAKRQPFDPAEVVALLDAARGKGDDQLADLIDLARWTGCRREELTALKVENVKDGFFTIHGAKTAAGDRDVPIHAELAPVMARLMKDSTDGYVLSGLTETKYGDRANAIGKRFGQLKTKLGHGPRAVFHSIRGTVITQLERAGVPEGTVQDLVGHERSTLTGSVYSGKSTLEMKAAALNKLAY